MIHLYYLEGDLLEECFLLHLCLYLDHHQLHHQNHLLLQLQIHHRLHHLRM
jgi:hypothetical protein